MRLNNKIAIITGAGSGIGQAIAQLFAREGAKTVVVDQFKERAETTVEMIRQAGGEALAVAADVSQREAVEQRMAQTLEQYGHIDILVNNAAVAEGLDILQFDETIWDLNLNVDLKSVFLCARTVLPVMIAQNSGAIVNIASVNGLSA